VTALRPHTSHWGAFDALVEQDQLIDVRPSPQDADPSPLLGNIAGSVRHRARIAGPMVRAGWLEQGPGSSDKRGAEPFVAVSWETAIELLSDELRRVYHTYGGEAVYGGSYGWGSAGRFHHAQSQVHRFLNCLGGYVRSVNTYSLSAGEVILDRVAGNMWHMLNHATTWPVIAENTDLIVTFGGMPLKNTAVNSGGVSRHTVSGHMQEIAARNTRFVLFSPLRDDLPDFVDATWHSLVPGTDVAVMLALAYVLIEEGLHDQDFLDRYCTGFEHFADYVQGRADGSPKTPEWAERLSQIPAPEIRSLARAMASSRTLITVTWSLQRTEHGEQAPWCGLALAAILGQIGLPGGGFGFGYGSIAFIGEAPLLSDLPVFPQGVNAVEAFIPVARISDMLLHPGEPFDYNGRKLTYPDIRLVYWCGGNPFHHHQDLARLRRALAKPGTIVVHDPFWTGMARHADIVLPSTMTLERNDFSGARHDPALMAMHQAIPPYAQARNDYDIFVDLAEALDIGEDFSEGRDEMGWLRHLYEKWRDGLPAGLGNLPSFDAFWREGSIELPQSGDNVLFDTFRADPERSPLGTPSGKIEIFSETIDGFGYDDCPGHPAWLEPVEWLGSPLAEQFPLHLIANNPKTRLHSQLDVGAYSQSAKVQGREPVRMHPDDARSRGIEDGDVVRMFNDRGSCLAGVVVTTDVRPGVVQLSTGAWYDPLDPGDPSSMCVHGNPNVLTRDEGTSKLAQGCAGQHTLVEIERWTEPLPPIRAYDPPPTK
jgi:biotin/methionine sulfoxide reductase